MSNNAHLYTFPAWLFMCYHQVCLFVVMEDAKVHCAFFLIYCNWENNFVWPEILKGNVLLLEPGPLVVSSVFLWAVGEQYPTLHKSCDYTLNTGIGAQKMWWLASCTMSWHHTGRHQAIHWCCGSDMNIDNGNVTGRQYYYGVIRTLVFLLPHCAEQEMIVILLLCYWWLLLQ